MAPNTYIVPSVLPMYTRPYATVGVAYQNSRAPNCESDCALHSSRPFLALSA